MRNIFLIYILYCYSSIVAQEAKLDFSKLNSEFYTSSTFSMSIKYELFLDGSNQPSETEHGKYIKYNKMYFTSQSNNNIVITKKYLFIIDNDAKVLAVDKQINDGQIMNPLSVNLDSLYLLYSKIEPLKSSSNKIKGYRLFIKEGPYTICDVYFDSSTYHITEIINVFREKIIDENNKSHTAVLKTTFYNYSNKSALYSHVFDDTYYIEKANGKLLPSKNYKNYKFINHLN